jgi:predicted ATP-grasp superfamily ATP-dependent carboligase
VVGALVVGGDYQGLGIARSLGRQGVPVCVLDDEISIARSSRFVQRSVRVPDLRGSQQTIDALVDVCDRLKLHGWVLFPTREENGRRDRSPPGDAHRAVPGSDARVVVGQLSMGQA